MNQGDTKLQSDAKMLRQRHPTSASLRGRVEGGREEGGGGERGRGEKGGWGRRGVMPKRLNSGFGHHRVDSCGPSIGRHKIA